MLKYLDEIMVEKFHKLIEIIWDAEEIPDDCNLALIHKNT